MKAENDFRISAKNKTVCISGSRDMSKTPDITMNANVPNEVFGQDEGFQKY